MAQVPYELKKSLKHLLVKCTPKLDINGIKEKGTGSLGYSLVVDKSAQSELVYVRRFVVDPYVYILA